MSVEYIDYEKAPKKRPGCLFYGCITAIVLAVLLGILVYLALRAGMNFLNQYTDDHPEPMPQVNLPEEDLKALHERWDAFRKNLESPETKAETLTLTQDDLNALIGENEDFRGKAHVTIEGNDIKGQVSLPLDLPGGRRYFNGKADLRATFDNGILLVTLQGAEVKGKPLPADFIKSMSNQNLAEDLYKKPENAQLMRKIESVEVKDGQIVVKTRAAKKEGSAEEKAKEGEAKKSDEASKEAETKPEEAPEADDTPKDEPAPKEAPKADEAPKSGLVLAPTPSLGMTLAA
jgi:hypothetical protein